MQNEVRANFPHITAITTRWMDNDVYGHVNNVTYYSYFDTAVNEYLIKGSVLDIANGKVIGLVVETGCTYFESIAFPDVVEVGVRVKRIGTSSVRYDVAIFKQGHTAVQAVGHFVHVYVDRATGRPTAIPDAVRNVLQRIQIPGDQ